MSAYLTKSQEKKLHETYKQYNAKRFHSMNAAIRTTKNCCSYLAFDDVTGEQVTRTDDCLTFYSYYTKCLSWYPKAHILHVSPIVYEGYGLTATTTRQVNRFLREQVAPNVDISVLQYGYTVTEPHHVYRIGQIHVGYSEHVDRLMPL